MDETPIQDLYPDDVAQCYGCGRLNPEGLHLKTVWDGEETLSRFTPRPYHVAIPGTVYGGLIASLIDCHGTGTAAAAAHRIEPDQAVARFVTASLQIDFRRPVPLGPEILVRGRVMEMKPRKVVVEVEVCVGESVCAEGRVVAVRLPEEAP